MPQSRTVTPLVCLILAVVALGLFFLANAGQAASGTVPTPTAETATADQPDKTKIADAYGKLPMSFVANEGQSDERVKFMARGRGYSLYLTANEAVLVLTRARAKEAAPSKPAAKPSPAVASPAASPAASPQPSPQDTRRVLRMELVGASNDPRVAGLDELPGKVNYLIGNDESRWRTNLPTFARVEYKEVYPGIGLLYYGNQQQLEYDFVVSPGAKPEDIKLRFKGADDLKLNGAGDLLITIAGQVVTMHKPFAYQAAGDGRRQEVQGRYVLKGDGQVVFEVKNFDKSKTLVIDPVIAYSTEIGSGGHDYSLAIAMDANGNAYITGHTDGGNFPTTAGSLRPGDVPYYGEAFVTKLNASGTALVYSTYIGGSNTETGYGIDVDASGNAYLTGRTNSADYPAVNAVKGVAGNLLNSGDGGAHWASKNVGSPPGNIQVLAVDPLSPNTIYAAGGWTKGGGIYKSTDGGNTWNAVNTGLTNAECVALVINPKTPSTIYAALNSYSTGQQGVYKSTDGGSNWTSVSNGLSSTVTTLAIDPKTPTTLYAGAYWGLYKTTDGGANWKLSNTGLNYYGLTAIIVNPVTPTVIYASAGGGGVFKSTNGGANWAQVNTGLSYTTVRSLAINPAAPATLYAGTAGGGVFKTTNSGSSWVAVNNGLPANTHAESLVLAPATPGTIYLGTSNGKIFKSDTAGSSWSVAYETLGTTVINTLAVDPAAAGKVYAGSFTDISYPLSDYEAFVSKLNSSGSALIYSTLLGGQEDDFGYAIAVDSAGAAYVTGNTTSPNFPLLNALQTALKGGWDVFVTKFNPSGTLAYSTFLGGQDYETGFGIAVDASGYAYLTGQTFSTDFPAVNAIPDTTGTVFVAKVNRVGNALVYSTPLSGYVGQAIAVDAAGSAYVTGYAGGEFKTTPGAFQTAHQGGSDAFLAKLTPAGSGLVYATFLGGSSEDTGRGVALDSSGNAYVTGISSSGDYPLVAGAVRTKSPFFKSADGGVNWDNSNYGLRGELVQALAIDPQNPSTLYAGTRTGGYKSTDGGSNWKEINAGEVVALVVDPLTPSTIYIAGLSSSVSGVFKSTDGGSSWTPIKNGLPGYAPMSLAIDPVTPSTLYLGLSGGPVYKTLNGGATWKPASSASPSYVGSFSISPAQPTLIYAAASMSTGGIFKSTNSGGAWQRLAPTQLTGGDSVAVSPANASVVFASSNNVLYKSTNGGTSWVQSHVPGGRVVFDPVNASNIYLLTFWDGLVKSTDGGATWRPINKGLRYKEAHTLVVDPAKPSTVYVGTQSFPPSDDIFVTKVNATGAALVYSTLLGPGEGLGVAVDAKSNAYVTGSAGPDLPVTQNSYQPFNIYYDDAFITKLGMSYSIRGQALNADGSPLSGVEVTLGGAQLKSVVTEGDGSYLFANLPGGSSFTVSAAKASYSFTPASQSFTNLSGDKTVNFKAAATATPFYTISGRLTNGGDGLAGVDVKLGGSQTRVATTDAAGHYSFTVAGGGSYTVTPAASAFSFSPANKTFSSLSSNQTADFASSRLNLVVTNTNDHGPGSLYQAVMDANQNAGADTITFKIPGTGVKTIVPRVVLPDVTDTLTIDATTQPGFAGAPLVVLDGSLTSQGAAIHLLAPNCTIRGLVIHSFHGEGIRVESAGNVIQGNYVGLDPTGKLRRPNFVGIAVYNYSNNTIGGTTASARNVISGNSFGGITIGNSHDNLVQGNYIGTDAAGASAIYNGDSGVRINASDSADSTAGNLIGGTTPGSGNLISGNETGVFISAPGNLVQGNLIGTDVTGAKKVGNQYGIQALVANTTVGGTAPGARNVISGNSNEGVQIGGEGSVLQGNFIGTDATGAAALGNGGNGVKAAEHALVGGTTPEARNVISANGGFGNVVLDYNYNGVAEVTIQGNYIGTDLTGRVALVNPSNGITIRSKGNLVGGLTPAARNVIAGNQVGIQIGDGDGYVTAEVTGNVVQGNYVGLNAEGTAPLPNAKEGIALLGTPNNVVGGVQAGAGNVIAFSGGAGVAVSPGTGNLVTHNSIFSNALLGIDLDTTGVTENDAGDADRGGNNLQNFPVLTSVVGGSSTTVQGSLKSKPSTAYTIDFYSNAACDASGYGEGARFVGTKKVTTDAAGNAAISATFAKPLPAGRTITATATDPDGNTSEFSPCDAKTTTGSIEFSAPVYNVLEDIGSATVTVVRTGGTKGQLTVNYATADQTAKAGSDYTATSGTLVFADGETSKTFTVKITNDNIVEPDETLRLTLSGLTDLETMGAYSTAVINIQGSNTPLYLFGDDVNVVEGNSGETNAVVTIKLSAATGRTVTVPYSTTAGGYYWTSPATEGTDYKPVSGTLVFGPGVTSQTLTVPIVGDTTDELPETFGIMLMGSAEAGVTHSPVVFIMDDEPDPAISISDATVVEGNPGPQANAAFTVKLSRPSDFDVKVYYKLVDVTATYNDYGSYLSGYVSFAPGQTALTIIVPVNADADDEPNETFLVQLQSPINATIADGEAVGTIVDDDPTRVSVANVTVTEGNTGTANATFKVSLSGPSAQPVTVKYATANSTAVAPADYTAASGTLTFAPGQTALNVAVPVVGDVSDEGDETFAVVLSAPTNAVLGVSQGYCTITDNDAPPTIKIGNVTVNEGNSGTVNAAFTVSLSAASGNNVYVNYETIDGTALAQLDYAPVSTSVLTFTPGQTSKTINVAVKGDPWDEPDAETFKVVLSNPANATIATAQGVCTIKDDDPLPSFKVNDVVVTEGDSGSTLVTFTVTLEGGTTQNTSVKFATSNGTAVAPGDYTAKALTTLSFGAGLGNVKEVSVYVKGDTLAESNETFNLTLSGATNATISDAVGVATITDDDGASSAQATKTAQTTSVREAASTVEFAEAAYSVNEGDGRLEVTVRRTGDLSSGLTVDYATADGTATDHSDYATALGQLSFAPGEESKTFALLLTDDAYAEGEETLRLNLSVREGAATPGGNSTAEVRIVDNDTTDGAVNPLDDALFFVRQQFVDILGREPEPEELSALARKLNECQDGDQTCTRTAVSVGLLFSDEYQSKAQLVHALYRTALGRAPQYREFALGMRQLAEVERSNREAAGVSDQAFLGQFVEKWLAESEVWGRKSGRTNREFVNALVGNARLDSGRGAELLSALVSKEKTRAEALLDVAASTKLKDEWRSEAQVLIHYFTYLRRDPEEQGFNLWVKEAEKDGTGRPMNLLTGFIGSGEYRQRFGRP